MLSLLVFWSLLFIFGILGLEDVGYSGFDFGVFIFKVVLCFCWNIFGNFWVYIL